MENVAILPIKKGYLYSLWSGKLRVHEGQVGYRDWNGNGIFKSITGNRFTCSMEPGIVFNAVVWLEEDDKQLACKILISYEKEQIQILQDKIMKLQEKIGNHQCKISLLEDAKNE
jgi:hypothetical protein